MFTMLGNINHSVGTLKFALSLLCNNLFSCMNSYPFPTYYITQNQFRWIILHYVHVAKLYYKLSEFSTDDNVYFALMSRERLSKIPARKMSSEVGLDWPPSCRVHIQLSVTIGSVTWTLALWQHNRSIQRISWTDEELQSRTQCWTYLASCHQWPKLQMEQRAQVKKLCEAVSFHEMKLRCSDSPAQTTLKLKG